MFPRSLRLRSQCVNETARWYPIIWLCWALACCSTLAQQATAGSVEPGFIGPYSLNAFSLTNTNADGSVSTADNGLSIVLIGGNNGSGLAGYTDLLITASGTGSVRFDYAYASLDRPGFGAGGYLVGQMFFQLADSDGQNGTIAFPIGVGQIFGFRVSTVDNQGEPGILTVSNFSAPVGASTASPEPGTLAMAFIGAGALLAFRKRSCRRP